MFTPIPFHDYPATDTPITAASLAAIQTNNASYTDSKFPIVDAQVADANKDGAAGVPSLRTLGAGSAQAAAGNDSRLNLVLSVDRYNAKGDGSTDDTTAVQNALNAASAIGAAIGVKIPLVFTPGNKYILSSLVPQSYVDVRAHGAVLQRNASFSTDHSLFFHNPVIGVGSPITEFALRGVRMSGIGGETPNQGLLRIGESTHITFKDCYVTNLAANAFYALDCQYVWVERNRLLNCTVVNPINLASGYYGVTQPLKHLWVSRNIVSTNAIGICVVGDETSTRTDPDVDAHITNNTCTSTGSGWPIAVEQGGSGPAPPNVSNIDISGNTCYQNGSGLYGITLTNDSRPASNDAHCISDVTVSGNRIFATGASGSGVFCDASRAAIVGNDIRAAVHDIVLHGHGTATSEHLTITGNVGHLGTGDEVHISGTQVDTTTLTSSNTP